MKIGDIVYLKNVGFPAEDYEGASAIVTNFIGKYVQVEIFFSKERYVLFKECAKIEDRPWLKRNLKKIKRSFEKLSETADEILETVNEKV